MTIKNCTAIQKKKKKLQEKQNTHRKMTRASNRQAQGDLSRSVTFRHTALSTFACFSLSLYLLLLLCAVSLPFSRVQFSFCFHFALQKLLLSSASTSSCESRLSDLAHRRHTHTHTHRYTHTDTPQYLLQSHPRLMSFYYAILIEKAEGKKGLKCM